ncbi:MAG TPA: hypothetical protein VMD76_03990 [Candidatus Sulfotelmatobacter sp.]|nr:hypothetical protein [Candidatus Sulfotelmatobacter sp.]
MRQFAIAVLKRLLASIAILISIAALGFLYGYFAGPSEIAYAGAVVLMAWPWALPQTFIVVSIMWFVAQRIKRSRQRVHVEPASPAN